MQKVHLANLKKDCSGTTSWCGREDPQRIVSNGYKFVDFPPGERCSMCGMLHDLALARSRGLKAL